MLQENDQVIVAENIESVDANIHEGYSAAEKQILDDEALIRRRLETAKTFISDNYIRVTNNCVILIAGATGKGKTTALCSAAVHEIRRGGKVGFFSNEMSRADLNYDIKQALQALGYAQADVLKMMTDRLKIYHSNDHQELLCYDSVHQFLLRETRLHEFALVIFDQLSGALKNSRTGTLEKPFEAMDKLVKEFKAWQADEDPLPPVVMAQQANPPNKKDGKLDMQAMLRNSRGTMEHVCLGIMITAGETGHIFSIGKGRKNFCVMQPSMGSVEVKFNQAAAIYEIADPLASLNLGALDEKT